MSAEAIPIDTILGSGTSAPVLRTNESSSRNIDRSHLRKRLRFSSRQSYIPKILTMGTILTPKRTDAKAQASPINKSKITSSAKVAKIRPASTSSSTLTPETDYIHAQVPECILGTSSEIRAIRVTLKQVLEQNQLLDKRVNSFSEMELLLKQFRQDLILANQKIQYLKDQLALVHKDSDYAHQDDNMTEQDFPTLSVPAPPTLGSSQSQWAKGGPKISNPIKTPTRNHKRITSRKIASYVRTFAYPSTNQQGFEFLYLPTQHKYPAKELDPKLSFDTIHLNRSEGGLGILYPIRQQAALQWRWHINRLNSKMQLLEE
ncbi:hypothetical protein HPULCUR_001310 [Helicostylum pulchrum]|uniref:Uncharacterized protein n=1 Tax=Helicostylum pulchrum TaxID=562976 RepID=A0ABP9XMC0_9FUNG